MSSLTKSYSPIICSAGTATSMAQWGLARTRRSRTHFDSISSFVLYEQVLITDASILAISMLPASASLFLRRRVSLTTLRSTLKPGLSVVSEESPANSQLNDNYYYINSSTIAMFYLPLAPQGRLPKQLLQKTPPHLHREVGFGNANVFVKDIPMVLQHLQAK